MVHLALMLPPRAVNDLLIYLFDKPNLTLATPLRMWLIVSPRFRTFVERYRDKIRKKVRTSQDRESDQDVYAELAVAYFLLQDHRCLVAYEKYGVGKERAPDFTLLFKTHIAINIEVTRLRAASQFQPNAVTDLATAPIINKVINTLCAKIGQLQPSVSNLLTLLTAPGLCTASDLTTALQVLQDHANQKDEGFFIRRGFVDRRDFHKQWQRLSGVLVRSLGDDHQTFFVTFWLNPQAKHALPKAVTTILQA